MVSRAALLPAINRNYPQVLDHNGFGLIVYASRNNIYVLDCRSLPPLFLDNKVLRNCHDKKTGRILSLSCCKCAFQGVVTSGEDSNVKIWNLETATCVAALQTLEVAKTVEWLHDSVASVVFSNHKSGVITKWNFSSNNTVKMKTAAEATVTVMSSNPKCPELLAVGHSNGIISIMNVVNHTLAHKLKTHSQEISSFSWSPIIPDMLLSTSLDMSARVWKLSEDKPVKTYYYPQSRYKVDDKNSIKLCSIFHPSDQNAIIVSNVRGELGSVTFKDNETPKFTRYTLDDNSNFKTVNILRLYFDEKDGKRRDLLLSSDHTKLSLWDIANQSLICSLPFTTGQIVKFSLSMLNSNYMAVCISDGTLRVWNVAAEESVQVSSTYVHFKVKITSAAWHPVEENLIAFGTNEGRVGVIDTYKKRPMYTYEAYHERSVYTIAWGPCHKIKDTNEKFFLYSCGGKVINIDELNKPKQRPLDFFTLVEKKEDLESAENTLSEFCWKMDYSCIAVGCTKGFIDIYSEEFKFLARFTMQVPTVEFLRWHPAQTSESPEGSPYKTWLAVSGRYANIHIIDTADMGGQFETTLCKPTVTLVGHKERVSSVCWSPHTDGRLASASKDGTVQVWNVINNTRIANYLCHMDLVSAVQWSIFDPDVIYSGGADSCLRIWNISHQSQTDIGSIPKNMRGNKYKPAVEKFLSESELASENAAPESVSTTVQEETVSDVAPKKERTKEKDENMLDINLKAEICPSKRVRSLFYHRLTKSFTKEGYLEGILKITDYMCSDEDDSNLEKSGQMVDNIKEEQDAFKYGLFTNQMSALKLLEMRAELESNVGQADKVACLQIMACNTESLIRVAAEKNKLTEFHLSLAPSVSYDFWREMCEKYGMQLIEAQQYIKGCMYLVNCGKVYQAISILLEKGLVLDALVLAKSRLPESDPVIRIILYRATAYFTEYNLPEAKTLCYIALNDASSAAKILYCSNDSKSMYAAAYVSKKFKLKESEDYAYFCMEKCLSQNDWPTFYKLLEHMENFRVYKAFVRVHELIAGHLKMLKKEEGLLAKDIYCKNGSQLCIWNGRLSETGQTVLAYICDTLRSEGTLPDDKEGLENIFNALDSMEAKRSKVEADAEAHIGIALCATKVIITSLLKEMHQAKIFFCQMFSASYNIVFLPKVVCWLFLPFDVYYCSDTRRYTLYMKSDKALPFETNFLNIYEILHSKFENIINSNGIEISLQDLQSNLKADIEKVITVLSKKCIDDSVVLYFVANYLNELERCTKKGLKYTCFENSSAVLGGDTKKSEDDVVNGQTACNPNLDKNVELVKDTNNGVENNSDISQNEIEKLIDIVCAEAEEKVQKIKECLGKSKKEDCAIAVNEDSVSLSPDEASDFIFIEKEESVNISKSITDSVKDLTRINSNEVCCDDLKQNYVNDCNYSVKMEDGRQLENDSVYNSSFDISDEFSTSAADKNCSNSKEDSSDMLLQTMPSETNVHHQCWNEVSLCFDLTKSLISVICKDEYAALYYLEMFLNELNRTLTDMAAAHSKSAISKPITNKKLCNAVKDAKQSENQEQIKLDKDELKYKVPSGGKDVNSSENEMQIKDDNSTENYSVPKGAINSDIQKEVTTEDAIGTCADVDNNLQNCGTDLNFEINSCSALMSAVVNSSLGSELTNNTENPSDSGAKSNDKLDAVADVSDTNTDDCKMGSDNGLNKNSELKTETLNGEIACSTSEDNRTENEIAAGDSKNAKDKKLEIGILKEWISNQIRILKSQEFCYPDPFDAVSNVKAICYNVFHKHPCQLVKTKFHELSHETIEWTTKYKTGIVSMSCDICEKEVKQSS